MTPHGSQHDGLVSEHEPHSQYPTAFVTVPRLCIADDDTDGHIDNFACFSAPGKVLLAWTEDETDPQVRRTPPPPPPRPI